MLVLLLPANILAKKDSSVQESEINRFFDTLMGLVSYDKYRDFYEGYIDKSEISYDNFVKEIKNKGVAISGAYGSSLVGWQRKGKRIVVVIDTTINSSTAKRLNLTLSETKDGLKIKLKELFKICHNKEMRRKK